MKEIDFDFKQAISVFNNSGNLAGFKYIFDQIKKDPKQIKAGCIASVFSKESVESHATFGFQKHSDWKNVNVQLLKKLEGKGKKIRLPEEEKLAQHLTEACKFPSRQHYWSLFPIMKGDVLLGIVLLGSIKTYVNKLPPALEEFFIFQLQLQRQGYIELAKNEGKQFKEKVAIEQLKIHQEELLVRTEELQEKQEELEASHRYFQHLFQYSPVGYVIINDATEIVEMNSQFRNWFNLNNLETRVLSFSKLLAVGDQNTFSRFLTQVFYSKSVHEADFEVQFEHSTKYFQLVAIILPNDGSNERKAQIALADITEVKKLQKKAEKSEKEQYSLSQEIQQSNEELRAREEELNAQLEEIQQLNHDIKRQEKLLNEASRINKVGGWEVWLDTNEVHWTEQTYRIYEIPIGDEVDVAKGVKYYKKGESRNVIIDAVENLLEKEAPFDVELKFITAKKREIWVRAIGKKDSIGGRQRIYGTFQDITEQKNKEKRISELFQLFELSPDLLSITNHKGYFLELNPAWEQALGYSIEELKSKPFIEFVHPEDVEVTMEKAKRLFKNFEGIKNFVNRYRHKDGSYRWLSWMAESSPQFGGRTYAATRDITEEIADKEELRKLAMLAKRTDNLVIITNREGYTEWVNHAFIQQTGFTLKDIFGKKPREVLQGEKTDKQAIARISKAIKEGKPINEELINYNKDGSEYWVNIDIRPVYNKQGELEQFISLQRITTENHEQENRLRNNIQLLEKANTELDNFVYRVSHDLRAPITSVLGLIEISKLTDDIETIYSYLNLQEKSMRKLDKFIQDILEYSRNARKKVERKRIDFEAMVAAVLEELQFSEESKVKVDVTVENTTPFYCDAYRLRIILSNLISNGIKYINAYVENKYIHLKLTVYEKQAIITYNDNGMGIGEEHLGRIFEMFYRATDENKGSGLGLYIVSETVEKLQGKITVTSKLGKGSTFIITLPNGKNPKKYQSAD